ncbi:MAG: efflux transporter periplasmic adaptor subunit [Gammaproteobacteria bacterium]
MKTTIRLVLYLVAAAGCVALITLSLRKEPIPVDTARVERGRVQVTVEEEGEVRAHDRYVLSAPVAGRLNRIDLHDGDSVTRDQVVAEIAPLPMSVREVSEQQARVNSAEARLREASDNEQHALADYQLARRENARIQKLLERSLVSTQDAEKARNAETTSRNMLDAAKNSTNSAQAELELARAGLIASATVTVTAGEQLPLVKLSSPTEGSVLRILEKSERVLSAGTPIMILGNATKLEVVVDVLSTEAVKIRPHMMADLINWGGENALRASVRTVERNAFTKVSALGIEEQRVNIVLDLIDPPDGLGDGYRTDVRIIVWEGTDVLRIPNSALFRLGEAYAVFRIAGGRVERQIVHIGHQGEFDAEVVGGINVGDELVVHPPNDLADGARVTVQNP